MLSAAHVPATFTKGIADREQFQKLRDYLLGSPDGPMPAQVDALLSAEYDAEESAAAASSATSAKAGSVYVVRSAADDAEESAARGELRTPLSIILHYSMRACARMRRGPISKRKENIRAFHRRDHQKSRDPPGPGVLELTSQHHSYRLLCPWPPLALPRAPLHGARRPRTRR